MMAIVCIIILILSHYGNRKTYAWYVQIACFFAYLLPMAVIVFLPLDLTLEKYYTCKESSDQLECDEPYIVVPQLFLYYFWATLYWISFNMQMFIVPIMQEYIRSGAFNTLGKLKDGVRENLIFYATVGGPVSLFILYALIGLSVPAAKLLDLAIPLSNACNICLILDGLLLLTLLMSYGLIEFPKSLWYQSMIKWKLKNIETELPGIKETCIDSEAEVLEITSICALARSKISPQDELRSKLDVILELVGLANSVHC